jgi:hypothetical protein
MHRRDSSGSRLRLQVLMPRVTKAVQFFLGQNQ